MQIIACICDPTQPWPSCESKASLDAEASLAPAVQQAARDVDVPRRMLLAQAMAEYEVDHMRRKLQAACNSAGEFKKIMGGALPNGCWEIVCSFPVRKPTLGKLGMAE